MPYPRVKKKSTYFRNDFNYVSWYFLVPAHFKIFQRLTIDISRSTNLTSSLRGFKLQISTFSVDGKEYAVSREQTIDRRQWTVDKMNRLNPILVTRISVGTLFVRNAQGTPSVF